MTIIELRKKMPEGYVMVEANLKGRDNFDGYNHVYHEGRIYLVFGLAWYARYPKTEFHNMVRAMIANNDKIYCCKDITENYKNNPKGMIAVRKLKLNLK